MNPKESIKRTLILGALLIGAAFASITSSGTSAEAAGGPSIYWAENFHIRQVDQASIPLTIWKPGMKTAAVQPTVDNLEGTVKSIAVDADNQLIYWANYKYQRIGRATLTGGNVEEKFIPNAGGVIGLVLDTTNNMLYWADIKNGRIQRVDLADPSPTLETLYSKKNAPGSISHPYGIALDVPHNMVYWTDVGTKSIQRAPMSGGPAADVEDLVSSKKFPGLKYFNRIRGIALDPDNNRMYWAIQLPSKIQYTDLNGNDAPVTMNFCASTCTNPLVVEQFKDKPYVKVSKKHTRPEWVAIDTDNDMLYWTQTRTHQEAIKRAKLGASGEAASVETVVDFLSIHAYSGVQKPTGLALAYNTNNSSCWSSTP